MWTISCIGTKAFIRCHTIDLLGRYINVLTACGIDVVIGFEKR